MGRSARVALSFAATDGSELHRIKPRPGQGCDGDDGIAGRKLPSATGADSGKEPREGSRSDRRTWVAGECACHCVNRSSNWRRAKAANTPTKISLSSLNSKRHSIAAKFAPPNTMQTANGTR